jgi:hypothetical protein
MRGARAWHALTALVAWAALVLQFVLVATGSGVLDETDPPSQGLAIARFFAYFTIQSNLLVAVTATQLARDPARDGELWRALRLAGVVGITVTGVVHFVLLRPLLDLDGADFVADRLLHMLVPLLAVAGWLAFGPRPRVWGADIRRVIAWPLAWLGFTLVVGAASGWYPYPFLDHREDAGVAGVVVTSLSVTAFFLILLALARAVDRRVARAPRLGSQA